MSIHRIRFSSIRNKWLRRTAMIAATPAMILFNWAAVVFALAVGAPVLFYRNTVKAFNGYGAAWNSVRVEDDQ